MKKFILYLAALLLPLGLQAQDYKKLEHNIEAGGGIFLPGGKEGQTGLAISLGYGLDIRTSQAFSIMPMVGYHCTSETLVRKQLCGADYDNFEFLDISVSARWHTGDGKTPITLGLAPVLSWTLQNDTYYIDGDPTDPFNGKKRLKPFTFGLMPSITFDVCRHFSLGFKANIGLMDATRHYDFAQQQAARHIITTELILRARF